LKSASIEPGPAGPAANEPNLPELLPIIKAAFITSRIAKIHQKDLSPELRGWKDAIKHFYKTEWVQAAKVK